MPIDPNLSDLFRATESPASSSLDAHQIIRRSKRRRLPSRIAVGSLVSLSVIGIGIASVNGIAALSPGVTASSGSAESLESADAPATDSGDASEGGFDAPGIMRAPAEKLNLCGGAVAEVAPSQSGLQLTVDFPDADTGSTSVSGTATLTNTGATVVTGYSGATPAVTLSRDGTVVWHSNGPTILSIVDITLAPGESMTYPASFTPVVCDVEDDITESFRDTLPAASPGEYQLSAALDVSGDAGTELVTGPSSTITLH
jgi:hypothetical protein